MLRTVVSFLVLLFFLSAPCAIAGNGGEAYDRVIKSGTLRCGYFVWAPYFQVDPNTQVKSGIYYDMIEELGKVLNIKIEWAYEYNLGQQVEALKSGKVDALCIDGPFTRSAMPFVEYTTPYAYISGYPYVLKSNKKIVDMTSLNNSNITFTAIDGDGSAEYLQLYFPKAKILSMSSSADASQLGQNIITKKADAMLNDPMSVNAYRAEDKAKLLMIGKDSPIATMHMGMSVAMGEESLKSILNQGIELMNDVGIIDKVLDKYDPKKELLRRPQKRFR